MKKLNLVTLLLAVAMVTTGCIKTVARFNPDGSGSMDVGFNLSVQNLEEASEASGEPSDDFDEITPLLESGEAIVDDVTGIAVSAAERLENGSMWTYITFTVPSIELWGKLETVSNEILPSDDEDLPTDPDSLTVVPIITVTDSTIRVEMMIPSNFDPDAEEDPFGMAAILGAFVQISYEIEMPGELIDHNGQIDTLTGNPVWLLEPNSPDDIEIYVESTLE
ncbi:MAG: hypothetical protein AAF846_11205 [Chloroflexota bacterium]